MNIDSPEERTVLHYQLHRQVDLSYYLKGKIMPLKGFSI